MQRVFAAHPVDQSRIIREHIIGDYVRTCGHRSGLVATITVSPVRKWNVNV